jgi:hypothetical protein
MFDLNWGQVLTVVGVVAGVAALATGVGVVMDIGILGLTAGEAATWLRPQA